jgi:2-dehydro-3-deoxyphosphogluconate aldolase/(4S)-4-hydroxy-2-oxoglutarate aldolase
MVDKLNSDLLYTALKQRILPAVTFYSADDALPVAEAILAGGLRVMEVPFRSGVAATAIGMIRGKFPEMYVGAGTLLSKTQMLQALDAGAQFGLAPGFNPSICENAMQLNFPFIPGVMTPSEIELTAEMGFKILKLFPAAQLGGVPFLSAIRSAYVQLEIQFIPMGGVSINNITDYLNLKNVIAVGGSWLATGELVAAKKFGKITEQVREALSKIV